MDIVTTTTMRSLADRRGLPSISIYMPTHRLGRETRQDPIRLGNLLDRAHAELVDLGMRGPDAETHLGEARGLLDLDDFWQFQEDGLATFVDPSGEVATYRLPTAFDELAVVADAFHVKPLWPYVSGNDLFYVLALSRGDVHLWWADRHRIGDVDLPTDMPTSLVEALWFDDPEKQLQHHGSARVGRGRVVASFHGHGVPEETDDAKLDQFLRAVDRGLWDLIDRDAPVVLAGVDDITARFGALSDHGAIVAGTVSGNVEHVPAEDIHRDALKIMQPLFDERLDEALSRFYASGDLQASELEVVVRSAVAGRVADVFVPLRRQAWGRVGDEGLEIEFHDERRSGDRDLLDVAASAAWANGGRVFAVAPDDVPGDGLLAARLRY